MPYFVVGDLLLGIPGPAGHLLLLCFFVLFAAPAVGFAVRRKWRIAAARQEEVLRLAAFAAEESARAEREAAYEYYAVSTAAAAAAAAAATTGVSKHQCAVCLCPTTTRCARCKAVRYCSGKCQIIHWRQGHKDECHPATTPVKYTAPGDDSDKKPESSHAEELRPEDGSMKVEGGSHAKLLEKSVEDSTSSSHMAEVSTDKNEHEVEGRSSADISEGNRSNVSPSLSYPSSGPFREREARDSVKSASADILTTDGLSGNDLACDDNQIKVTKTASLKFSSAPSPVSTNPPSRMFKQKTASSGSDGFADSWVIESDSCINVEASVASLDSSGIQVVDQNSSSDPGNDSMSKFSFNLSAQTVTSDACVSAGTHKRNTTKKVSAGGTNYDQQCDEVAVDKGPQLSGSGRPSYLSKERGNKEGTLKFWEQRSLSFSADNDLQSPTVERYSSSSDTSSKVSNVCSGLNSSSDVAASSLSGNNGLKTSMWKVVQQFKSPKLSKQFHQSGLADEISGKYGYKVLFPYDLFSKLFQEKVELVPCGLTNCGNSCFANVVLQCLTFTRPLSAFFLRGLHSKTCAKKGWCFTCEFEDLVSKVKQGKSPISPNEILSHSNLGHGKEEDAHEFLRYAIDAMQSVCLMEAGANVTCPLVEDTTFIQLIFGGYLKSKIKCMKCRGKSEITERMLDLTVEIQGDVRTLEDALKRFTMTEILDGENKYRCGRCKSYERAKKKLTILEAPNILTIALKRFQSGKFGKLNKLVTFPEILNLAPYMGASTDKTPVYSLYAVIVHLDIMNAAFSGHYVCYVKSGQGKWYKADDSMVKPVERDKVLSKGAYLLLYARCSPRAPSSLKSLMSHVSNGKISKDFEEKPLSHDERNSKGRPGRFSSGVHSFEENRQWRNLEDSANSDPSGFFPMYRIPKVDSSSDNSSLFSCSDEGSYSTDSTRDSTSNDDISDYIFGDAGRSSWNSPVRVWDESDGCSISPLYSRRSPLSVSSRTSYDGYSTSDLYSLRRAETSVQKGNPSPLYHKIKSSNLTNSSSSSSSSDSDWKKNIGCLNPCEVKSNVTLRRPRDRTQTYY